MSKLKDVGLIKMLLLVGALVVANIYVSDRASRLDAQIPGSDFVCVGPQGEPSSYCEWHPIMFCTTTDCTGATIEP